MLTKVVSLHHLIAKILKTIETMKASKTNQNESEIGVTGSPESGSFKGLMSEDKNNHQDKDTKDDSLFQEIGRICKSDPFLHMNNALDYGINKLSALLERSRNRHVFSAIVTIYQEDYDVIYSYFDKVIEVTSVDGHTNIEDTFKDRFIEMVIERIEEQIITAKDNDDRYDDHFQNI